MANRDEDTFSNELQDRKSGGSNWEGGKEIEDAEEARLKLLLLFLRPIPFLHWIDGMARKPYSRGVDPSSHRIETTEMKGWEAR